MRTAGSGKEERKLVQFLMALKPIWLDQEDMEQTNSDLLGELEAQWKAKKLAESDRRNITPQKRLASSPDRSSKRRKGAGRTSQTS